MAKAIVTKYVGPTDFRGSRIVARAEGVPSLSVGYDSALNSEENHAVAAAKICAKYDWSGELVSGGLPNGDTVHVFAPRAPRAALQQIADGNVMSDKPGYSHLDTVVAYQAIARAALATLAKGS